MARNYTAQAIVGVEQEDKTNSKRIQDWVAEHTGQVKPLSEWVSDVTRHKLVNVAFGAGADSEEFELSESTRMVVTADEHEEVKAVSNRYNIVNNQKVVQTLADVLDDFNLQDNVYGSGRNYKNQVAVDLFFDAHSSVFNTSFDINGDDLEFGVGIRAANDKSQSVKIEPLVRYSDNSIMRNIDDGERKFKHVKSEDEDSRDMYDDMYEMFGECIFNLGYLADTFIETVRKADAFMIDMDQEEFDIEEFYREWLPSTIPDTVVEAAVKQSQVKEGIITEAAEPKEEPKLSVYSIVYGFTHAVNHASNVSDGATLDRWHNTAQEALSSPDRLLNKVRSDYQAETEDETDDDESLAENAAKIQSEISDMRNKADD